MKRANVAVAPHNVPAGASESPKRNLPNEPEERGFLNEECSGGGVGSGRGGCSGGGGNCETGNARVFGLTLRSGRVVVSAFKSRSPNAYKTQTTLSSAAEASSVSVCETGDSSCYGEQLANPSLARQGLREKPLVLAHTGLLFLEGAAEQKTSGGTLRPMEAVEIKTNATKPVDIENLGTVIKVEGFLVPLCSHLEPRDLAALACTQRGVHRRIVSFGDIRSSLLAAQHDARAFSLSGKLRSVLATEDRSNDPLLRSHSRELARYIYFSYYARLTDAVFASNVAEQLRVARALDSLMRNFLTWVLLRFNTLILDACEVAFDAFAASCRTERLPLSALAGIWLSSADRVYLTLHNPKGKFPPLLFAALAASSEEIFQVFFSHLRFRVPRLNEYLNLLLSGERNLVEFYDILQFLVDLFARCAFSNCDLNLRASCRIARRLRIMDNDLPSTFGAGAGALAGSGSGAAAASDAGACETGNVGSYPSMQIPLLLSPEALMAVYHWCERSGASELDLLRILVEQERGNLVRSNRRVFRRDSNTTLVENQLFNCGIDAFIEVIDSMPSACFWLPSLAKRLFFMVEGVASCNELYRLSQEALACVVSKPSRWWSALSNERQSEVFQCFLRKNLKPRVPFSDQYFSPLVAALRSAHKTSRKPHKHTPKIIGAQ